MNYLQAEPAGLGEVIPKGMVFMVVFGSSPQSTGLLYIKYRKLSMFGSRSKTAVGINQKLPLIQIATCCSKRIKRKEKG